MCNITRWDKKISPEDLTKEIELSNKFAKVMASITLAEKYVSDPTSMPIYVSMDTNKAYQAVTDIQHIDHRDMVDLAQTFINRKVGNAGLIDLDEYADELSLDATDLKDEDIQQNSVLEYGEEEEEDQYQSEEDDFE